MYEPLPAFLWPATILGLVGLALLARFGWLYITETGPTGHIQSLIVGATFLISALQLVLLGVIGELLRMNRASRSGPSIACASSSSPWASAPKPSRRRAPRHLQRSSGREAKPELWRVRASTIPGPGR